MDIFLLPDATRKLKFAKSQDRLFYLEFPHNSNTAELYGVVSELKETLWEALEKDKLDKEKKCEESCENCEVPKETVVEQVKE